MSAGADWVDRYLQPRLERTLLESKPRLDCLQLGPDDDEEAGRLRQLGHTCTVMLTSLEPYRTWRWHQPPVVGDALCSVFRDASFDLIFTGWIGKLTQSGAALPEVARALCRVLRPGGAMLLSASNRWCPADLVDRRLSVPGAGRPAKLSLVEIERAFEGLPVDIERLPIAGHFRWGRLPGPLRGLAPLLNSYLAACGSPGNRFVYSSPMNPLLMLWVSRRRT
ncbi:MAG: class I SAM-dependent methyltransferase [Acidobacteria bacterium]|nr:class I SAM-dependent methyltransferase [Acidobacteriota bacterium]